MRTHEPTLVIGSADHASDQLTFNWADVHETCLACFLDGGDDAEPGPCTQVEADACHLTPGALVQVRRASRWKRVPASTAVVIGSIGSGRPGLMALIWFWGLGQPEVTRTVFTVTPDEVTPLHTTLATLPVQSYRILAARHAASRGPAARLLAPLTEPLTRAVH